MEQIKVLMANQAIQRELQTLVAVVEVEDLTLTKVPMVAQAVLEQTDLAAEAVALLRHQVALVTEALVVLVVLTVFTLAVQVVQEQEAIDLNLVALEAVLEY
jgi:hypothetical protein